LIPFAANIFEVEYVNLNAFLDNLITAQARAIKSLVVMDVTTLLLDAPCSRRIETKLTGLQNLHAIHELHEYLGWPNLNELEET
jgi:hypothetical protein